MQKLHFIYKEDETLQKGHIFITSIFLIILNVFQEKKGQGEEWPKKYEKLLRENFPS